MRRGRRGVGRGFSLLEMMVSIAILSILLSMAAGPYNQYRSRQEANQCAQGLASVLKQTASYALRNESYAYFHILSPTTYEIRVQRMLPGPDGIIGTTDDTYAYEPMRGGGSEAAPTGFDISAETPRARLSPVGAYIAFGPKGWLNEVQVASDTYGYTHGITVATETLGAISYTYYPLTVSSGPSVGQTYTIRVYKNGRVKVI